MKKDKKQAKKKKKQAAAAPLKAVPTEDLVMLGIRMSVSEREKIKIYAVAHHTSVAMLIREFIASLPDPRSV